MPRNPRELFPETGCHRFDISEGAMGGCGHLAVFFSLEYPSKNPGFDIREGMASFIHA